MFKGFGPARLVKKEGNPLLKESKLQLNPAFGYLIHPIKHFQLFIASKIN